MGYGHSPHLYRGKMVMKKILKALLLTAAIMCGISLCGTIIFALACVLTPPVAATLFLFFEVAVITFMVVYENI